VLHLQLDSKQRSATFVSKIECKEKGAARGGNCVKAGADIINPTACSTERRKSRKANQDESEAVEVEWNRETVNRLKTTEH